MSQAIGGGVVGAIIGFLLAQGFQKVKAESDKIGNTIISGNKPDGAPFSIQIKNDAIISPQFDIVKVTAASTVTKRDDANPQYELKNTSGVIKRILSIAVIPDSVLQTEGLMTIQLNDSRFFPITDPTAGFLEDVDSFNVPIPDNYGMKILPKQSLKMYLWNPSGNAVSATIAVFIGELP